MSQKLSALAVGTKVKDTNTLYLGKPLIFKIADKNHTGYPADSVTLITEKILCLKAFDAREAANPDDDRKNSGNNRYLHGNIRQWLNSDKSSSWYTAQHAYDAPPNSDNCANYYASYDSEAGFLYRFSASMKAALMPTTLTVAQNGGSDGSGFDTITDKIFIASETEIGITGGSGFTEGSALTLFSNNTSRLAYPTAEAVSNTYSPPANFKTDTAYDWWLRTPDKHYSERGRRVTNTGGSYLAYAYYGYGVRPLCNISSDILVSDTADADGAYTIIWTKPPTAPTALTTTPGTILGGKSASVSWGASTPDTGTSIGGYILERAYNNGAFAQIYKGTSRTYTDTVTFGWTTVQYRVKAYDNNTSESAYTTTAVLNVINSNAPKINGSDSNLGAKTGAFSQTYTVTNPDASITKTLIVVEKIDGKQKRSYTATSGATNTFSVTADEWLELLNGSHTLTVTVTDNYEGTATRTYTFSKSVTEIEFTLKTPLTADAAVTKAVMNISRQIPTGADFSIEACNNAYDATPTWENVTAAITAGTKFYLSNKTKTATNWGFNIRVKVNRQSASGDCYIKGIGGNFE